jgi:hypothetical protein
MAIPISLLERYGVWIRHRLPPRFSSKWVQNVAGSESGNRVDNNQEQEDEPNALLKLGRYWGDESFYSVQDKPDHPGENDGSDQEPK